MGGNFYSYSFVRLDLPIGQQIIQHGHAAHEAALLARDPPGTVAPNAVLFEVANEAELIKISRVLRSRSVKYAMFFEPDYDRGFTALTTAPIHANDDQRLVFRDYKLYGAGGVPTLAP